MARDLAEAMRKSMGGGANFVVENVNGAGGTIGAAKVAKAAPDGHTLLLHHIGMASAPALYRKLSYKPLDDFEYVGMINEVPMTLIGKPQLPANNYRDFENYIKANAGKLNIAHAGLGSASHLCGLMWQSAIKANDAMTTIPFGGTAPAMNTGGRSGRPDVRPDHQHHRPDRGRPCQGVCRDHGQAPVRQQTAQGLSDAAGHGLEGI